jgi:predicted DNA-binding protein (UPF0251 family)/predicted Fe-Mo cluster-binding NifX family protein
MIMARPCKSRTLEGAPSPVVYIPSGWTHAQTSPIEVAIEDFEVLRLVDGHAHSIEEAAGKVGVSRSTAGRMLERARRNLALGLERRSPIYIDALESSVLTPSLPEVVQPISKGVVFAIAVRSNEMNGEVSRVFGRATGFAVVSASGDMRYVENPGSGIKREAATLAVDLLKANGVGRIVAGRFGPEALEKLGEAGIEPLIAVGTKVSQAIELFRSENI